MARYGENWTREELILAFSLYSEIPFGQIHMRNRKVLELAKRLTMPKIRFSISCEVHHVQPLPNENGIGIYCDR
jgi:hypothetical protein